MAQRGARNLIFKGRSGANKPAGRALVADLEKSGIDVEVFTGYISIPNDVQRLVNSTLDRFGMGGGVVHAAMSLHVSS